MRTERLKQLAGINEAKETVFIAFYNKKKTEITAKSLWDAKQKAIAQLKILN